MKDLGIIKGEPTKENGLIPVELGDGTLVYAQWIPNSEPLVGLAVEVEKTAAGSMLATAKNSHTFNDLFKQSGLQKYTKRASWDVDFGNGKVWNEPFGKPKKKSYQVAILGANIFDSEQFLLSNVGQTLTTFNFPNWSSSESALLAKNDGWDLLTAYRKFTGDSRETFIYRHNSDVGVELSVGVYPRTGQTRLIGAFYHPDKAFISQYGDSLVYSSGDVSIFPNSLTVPETFSTNVSLSNPPEQENILVMVDYEGLSSIEKEANFNYRFGSGLGTYVTTASEVSFWLTQNNQRKKLNSKISFRNTTNVIAGIGTYSFPLPQSFQGGYTGWLNYTGIVDNVCYFSEDTPEVNPLLGVKVCYVVKMSEDSFTKYSGTVTNLAEGSFNVAFTEKIDIDYDVVYEELNFPNYDSPVIYSEQSSITEFLCMEKPQVSYAWGRHTHPQYESGLWLPYTGFTQTWGQSGSVIEGPDFPISWIGDNLIRSSKKQRKRLTEGLIYAEVFELVDNGDFIDVIRVDELLECTVDIFGLGQNFTEAWQNVYFVKKMAFSLEEI